MIRFLISCFVSKEKALELLEENQETLEHISGKNLYLEKTVKTGFKLWSIWKIILMIWWGIILFLLFVGVYVAYLLISRFV